MWFAVCLFVCLVGWSLACLFCHSVAPALSSLLSGASLVLEAIHTQTSSSAGPPASKKCLAER
jgi:hypothetical protein